jgi:hypothetical protein
MAPSSSVKRKPIITGIPIWPMRMAPNTPPGIPTDPAVKLKTREAENMTL